ncbi:MAG: hypothetical protein HUU41_17955 [Bryobacteraceae bacterium]|nr:hypothetical protein [Bryobacteraceae bacterium]
MLNHGSTHPTPEPILELQRQLEDFRSSQPGRMKLPESLWQAAVELARRYGIYPVAYPLRLDYVGLKKRLGEVSPPDRQKAAAPAFVELVAAQPATLEACVIEFESARGAKMRIHWKATTPPDWTNLLHAWRETEK